MSPSRELVKLYYRIGEVSQIVGVQPHVLRYWETEFRTIRPQKSHKGQRVYSRRDVEKLLKVKDLLKTQGFTIAGAKKKLREPEADATAPASPVVQAAPATLLLAAEPVGDPQPIQAESVAAVVTPSFPPRVAQTSRMERARMREALLSIREDIASMLHDLETPVRRPKLPTIP